MRACIDVLEIKEDIKKHIRGFRYRDSPLIEL
jgi:hypothetical protein